jgi:hypothetical protein
VVAQKKKAPTNAAAGSVTTRATTMLLTMFQRIAETRRAAATPMIAPVIVCAVQTGTPRWVGRREQRDGAVGPWQSKLA